MVTGCLKISASIWLALGAIQAGAATPLRVMLDAGHGGKDHGARHEAVSESQITLSLVEKLKSRLGQDARFRVLLTRQDDEFLELEDRVRRSEKAKAEVFLSLHVNWSSDPAARGMEVYFQNQLPPDEESMFLAARENQQKHGLQSSLLAASSELDRSTTPEVQLILQDLDRNHRIYLSSELAKAVRRNWKGSNKAISKSIRQAPFFVISHLTVPSILVEVGFLSHPNERKKLLSEDYQDLMAQGLYKALVEFYESLDKSPNSRLN